MFRVFDVTIGYEKADENDKQTSVPAISCIIDIQCPPAVQLVLNKRIILAYLTSGEHNDAFTHYSLEAKGGYKFAITLIILNK